MSSRLIFKILFLIMFVIPGISGITLFASDTITGNNDTIILRLPNSDFAEFYKSQKDFNYTPPPVKPNPLKDLYKFLGTKLKRLINMIDHFPIILQILFWGLAIFFVFIIVTKTNIYKAFYTDTNIKNPDYHFHSIENRTIDYDNEIQKHVGQKQYRMAIRLHYLKLINLLSGNELINYSKDKTNLDYLHELTSDDLKTRFSSTTLIFNHVWYGDIEINEDQFSWFSSKFQEFYNTIDVKK